MDQDPPVTFTEKLARIEQQLDAIEDMLHAEYGTAP